MRRILWYLVGLYSTFSVAIMGATWFGLRSNCGAYLNLQSHYVSSIVDTVDPHSQIRLHTVFSAFEQTTSPDNRYAYRYGREQNSDSEREILIATRADTIQWEALTTSRSLAQVFWSADSSTLIVWEEDSTAIEVNRLAGIEVATGEEDYTHEFYGRLTDFRLSPTGQYLFAHISLDTHSNQGRTGVVIVDTITGNVSRFEMSPEFYYRLQAYSRWAYSRWSQDDNWVIIGYDRVFYVINPTTGLSHPRLPIVIRGTHPTWGENDIFYVSESGINQISLDSGDISTIVGGEVSLRAVNQTHAWFYTPDAAGSDSVDRLYHTPSNTHHSLEGIRGRHQQSYPEFSPNGQCLAIVLHDTLDYNDNRLLIYDVRSSSPRLIGQLEIWRVNIQDSLWRSSS